MSTTATDSFWTQYDALAASDAVLAGLLDTWGRHNPYNWSENHEASHGRGLASNFDAMVLHIIRQQVSLAAADAIYDRVASRVGGSVTPIAIATASGDDLRAAGLSRQKVSYVVDLAQRHLAGSIDLDDMHHLTDDEAVPALTAVRGIGRWTAEVFMIAQLHREDVLPANDVGIRRAVQLAWHLDSMPSEKDVRQRGEQWAPYRTFASEVLWYSLPEVHQRPSSAPTTPTVVG